MYKKIFLLIGIISIFNGCKIFQDIKEEYLILDEVKVERGLNGEKSGKNKIAKNIPINTVLKIQDNKNNYKISIYKKCMKPNDNNCGKKRISIINNKKYIFKEKGRYNLQVHIDETQITYIYNVK